MTDTETERRQSTLRYPQIPVLALIGLLVSSLLGWKVYQDRQEDLRYWETRLTATADHRKEIVESWLSERRGDCVAAGDLLTIPTERKAEQRAWVEHVRAQYIDALGYAGVFAYAGGSTTATQVISNIAEPPGMADSVRSAIETGTFAVHRCDDDRRPWLVVACPIFNSGVSATAPQVIGAIALVMDPEQSLFPLLLHESVPTRTGETLLARVGVDGVVFRSLLRFAPPAEVMERAVGAGTLAALAAARGQEGFGEFTDYRGVRVLAATRRIVPTAWGLVAKIDRDEAFEAFRQDAWETVGLGVLMLLALSQFGLASARRQRAHALAAELSQERSLREAQDRYRTLVESVPEAIVTIDQQGQIVSANPATARLFGFAENDLVGRNVSVLMPEPHASRHNDYIAEYLRTGTAKIIGATREVTGKRRDGGTFPLELSVSEMWANGERVFTGIIRDVSERKRAEASVHALNADLERRVRERTQELERSNQELESFSYSVSHDLRAPLRHMDGFVKLLRDREGDRLDVTSARYLHLISQAARKMATLIDSLLTFSRSGRTELQIRRLELTRLVREVQRELMAVTPDRTIEWEIGPLPSVVGDPALLRQVWTNLLSNAIKYTSRRPDARIQVTALGGGNGEVVIAVRDNGAGFDPQYAHKLFGVFQRLHRTEEFEGTGIGLAIVQRIIQRHGGRVWAEGLVDQGATFYVALRAADGGH